MSSANDAAPRPASGWRTRARGPLLGGGALLVIVGLVAVLNPAPARSEPFIPASAAQILDRLPDRVAGSASPVAAVVSPEPIRDAALAERLARDDIRSYQASSDPRYLGHAEARLSAFWDVTDAPVPIVVLRAKIRASNHDFEPALRDLDTALARAPTDSQALFERASIRSVLGRYDEARQDCAALAPLVSELFALGCSTVVRGATGDARAAASDLELALARARGLSPTDAAWAASLIGELQVRTGDAAQAETWLKRALAGSPQDAYTLGVLADLLLDLQRPAEVVSLLSAFERVDALLLRLALAEQQLKLPQANPHGALLAERFADARLRGSAVHRREEARFELSLRGNPTRALELALANFGVQREAWDLRLVLAAALAAHKPEQASDARAFARRSGIQDPTISKLLRALEDGQR
jgi:Flp pilus assembly protein TadD